MLKVTGNLIESSPIHHLRAFKDRRNFFIRFKIENNCTSSDTFGKQTV